MADIEIIRESADGYTHQGHAVTYTDTYIKVLRSFRRQALKVLQGAPLAVFLDIVLSEEPLTVNDICEDTGIKSHTTVCNAIDFLVKRRFIEDLGRVGKHGPKRYRALSYAWCGPDKDAPTELLDNSVRIPKSGIRQLPPPNGIPQPKVESDGSKNGIRSAKSGIRPPKDGIRTYMMNDDVHPNQNHKVDTSSIHVRAAREKILETVFEGVNVQRLAEIIPSDENAQAWVDWCNDSETQMRYKNPAGFAYTTLMRDANALPPVKKMQTKHFRVNGTGIRLSIHMQKLLNKYEDGTPIESSSNNAEFTAR